MPVLPQQEVFSRTPAQRPWSLDSRWQRPTLVSDYVRFTVAGNGAKGADILSWDG